MPDVLVTLRDREVARVPIRSAQMTIGRDASCDVTIDSPAISRRHALLVCDGGRYHVRDQDSENGISFGGHRVLEAELHFDADSYVTLGKFQLQIVSGAPGMPLRPSGPAAHAAAHAAAQGPRNVVRTVAIDDEAAQRIHARLASKSSGAPEAIVRRKPGTERSDRAWLWWAAAVFVLSFGIVIAMRMFG